MYGMAADGATKSERHATGQTKPLLSRWTEPPFLDSKRNQGDHEDLVCFNLMSSELSGSSDPDYGD